MTEEKKVVRCICMSSGGLDSLITKQMVKRAAKDCEIEPKLLSVLGPFWGDIEGSDIYMDIDEGYFSMLRNPDHGYGKNLNPCKDCKIYMLRRARAYMEEHGMDFVATGEVLGQRPNSQMRPGLNTIAEDSGLKDHLLRPLSGKLLPASWPEKQGYIDREKLGDISGRGRNRQFEYAKEYGIDKYPSPAGGCRLTDTAYCTKIKTLFECFGDINWFECEIVRKGRLIKYAPHKVLMVGRNHEDNEYLLDVYKRYSDPESEYRKAHPARKAVNPFCLLVNHMETVKRPCIVCLGEAEPSEETVIAMKEALAKFSSNPEDKPAPAPQATEGPDAKKEPAKAEDKQ